jgi:hypothetical protein
VKKDRSRFLSRLPPFLRLSTGATTLGGWPSLQ